MTLTDTESAGAPGETNEAARPATPSRIDRLLLGVTSDQGLLLMAIVLLGLCIRLYRLNDIPAEMWGDVVTHYQLAQNVMSGHFYFDYEFGGDGPMLSYLAAVMAGIFGLSFLTLKLTTVLIGTAVVAVTYFLARDLFDNSRIGLLAAFLTATSFWGITFSRQAKPYILVALFATGAVVLVLRKKPIWAGVVLGLGMYTQAAFWGTPVAFLVSPLTLLVAAIWASPVLISFARDPQSLVGSSSYIGEKLHAQRSVADIVVQVLDNIRKNALALNVRGDQVFRHNIPGHPHLDEISGAFFLLGMVLILIRIVRGRDRRLLLWFLVPILVIQIPSVLDMHGENVPAMGRTVGIMPFACTAIAYAVYALWVRLAALLRHRVGRPDMAAGGIIACVLAAIMALNLYNYFEVYPRTLPNGNTPFDAVIAGQVDRASPGTVSILVGCCWGEWGQPEPDAVLYRVRPGATILLAPSVGDVKSAVQSTAHPGTHVVLYTSPPTQNAPLLSVPSLTLGKGHMLRSGGWDVAWVIPGRVLP